MFSRVSGFRVYVRCCRVWGFKLSPNPKPSSKGSYQLRHLCIITAEVGEDSRDGKVHLGAFQNNGLRAFWAKVS